jgi:predicted phage terminase large subunit-like protein
MSADLRAFDALLRQQLYPFVWKAFGTLNPGERFLPAWHVEAMCFALQEVAAGHCRRLLITVPPRHLKSICTAVALPAWLLGRSPTVRIMVASYGGDLAAKHARDFRQLIQAPWYRRLFPSFAIDPRRNTETEILTTRRGFRKAVSLGGAVTGFGADLLIVDDLMKAADASSATERQRVKDYYEQTLFSRLDDKQNGRIVVIQQRLHEDDLPGYLLDRGNFTHLNLRAIAEENEAFPLGMGRMGRRQAGEPLFAAREPLSALEDIRREIGSFAFSSQYQQNPVPPEGNRLRWGWFRTYDQTPERSELLMVVQSWDTAATAEPTSDFSVCTTWGLTKEGKWLLLDVERARLEYPSLKRRVIALRRLWRADRLVVEYAGPGIPLVSDLRQELPHERDVIVAYQPLVDKETRLMGQTAPIEAGEVLLPREAPWLTGFKQELLAFPNGRHDDQVDSMAQFLDWVGRRRGRSQVATLMNGGIRPRPPGRRHHAVASSPLRRAP